jgi:hypothetical protein
LTALPVTETTSSSPGTSSFPTTSANLCQSSANVIQNGNFYEPAIGSNPFPPWVFTSPFSNVEPYVQIYETPDNSPNSL